MQRAFPVRAMVITSSEICMNFAVKIVFLLCFGALGRSDYWQVWTTRPKPQWTRLWRSDVELFEHCDHKSTLVQVMAWCRQARSHYLSQCWPKSLSPYDVTRPQWVNETSVWWLGVKWASTLQHIMDVSKNIYLHECKKKMDFCKTDCKEVWRKHCHKFHLPNWPFYLSQAVRVEVKLKLMPVLGLM